MQNLLYFIVCSIILISCLTNCNNCPDHLEFDLPIEAYGVSDTVSMNDTIRIKVTIPDKLYERVTNKRFQFTDYDFKLITYIVKHDTFPAEPVTESYFDWITQTGQSKFIAGGYSVIPSYHDNIYQYEVRIIPRKSGLFEFGMNSLFDTSQLDEPDGPCSEKPVNVYMKLQNSIDVNYEFLQKSTSPAVRKTKRKQFDEYAGICFYVR
jgi:hypothetical protein